MALFSPALEILHEDEHLLAVVKPVGLPTAHAPRGGDSLYARARVGRPFVGVVTRLDLPVSGVVVFAASSAAAADLSRQFRERSVAKDYVAVTEGRFPAPLGTWVEWVDRLARRGDARAGGGAGARAALDDDGDGNDDDDEPGAESRARARVIQRAGEVSCVELAPATGRKHQLRIQLASRGCPIVGDRRYGARLPFPAGIALHARSLVLRHPGTGRQVRFEAPPPVEWRRRFASLRFTG